jgi:hypothetical protein
MNSSQIQKLIETQIQDNWDNQNVHGFEINQVRNWLILPELTTVVFRDFIGEHKDQLEQAWLVLIETSPDSTGYRIVAAEDGSEFYLAVQDSEDHNRLLILHSCEDFVTTFMGM